MKKKIIFIVGPTASGKTALSIKLAQALDGEIINADSTQIFEGTDIATNKVTTAEMQDIPHHLLSIRKVNEEYSVADFQRDARNCIAEIQNRSKTPIVIGGTGLYINAVLFNYNFVKSERIADFEQQFNHLSNQELWDYLAQQDFEAAQAIHPNNRYRVVRALEIKATTGTSKTTTIKNNKNYFYNNNDIIIIGLEPNREQLYQRINNRVLTLTNLGLFAEITNAYQACNQKPSQALSCIGGKEIIMYLNQEISYDDCITLMQKNNRHYARRQFTWFKNQLQDCHWFKYNFENYETTCLEIIKFIKENVV